MSKTFFRFLRSFFIFLIVSSYGFADEIVVFVPKAKLREEPKFSAKVQATVPEGTALSATGKRHDSKSSEDYLSLIDESWSQVEYEGKTLWVPRRDCLSSKNYGLIKSAHKAGIAGDIKAMITALGKHATVSPDGQCAFVAYDPDLFGVFAAGRGLVEWFATDSIGDARWSPDSRYLVLEVVYGPRNVYDMQKERAIYAGEYNYLYQQFKEEFTPGFYLYTAPGDVLSDAKGEKGYEIYYQPQIWAVDLDKGERFLLLEGVKGSLQKHGGAWSMEMELKAKDVPDAIKATEMWQQYNGGLMVCPMTYDQGG